MKNVKFSVITVCYNGAKEIEKTLESVLNQTVSPFEYIIIDGESTDNTLEIVSNYRDEFEKKGIRLIVKSEKDQGLYYAMNKGIDVASGDFVSFINVGDWYELDAIKNVCDLYENQEFDMTYGGIHYIKADGKMFNKMSKKDIFVTSRHWNHPSMFLKREFYEKYHFDTSYKIFADFDLFLKLRKDKECRICISDKILSNFKAGGVSNDRAHLKERQKEKYAAYRHNGYSRIYWVEAYIYEWLKCVYLKRKGD